MGEYLNLIGGLAMFILLGLIVLAPASLLAQVVFFFLKRLWHRLLWGVFGFKPRILSDEVALNTAQMIAKMHFEEWQKNHPEEEMSAEEKTRGMRDHVEFSRAVIAEYAAQYDLQK